jgi:phosphomannomutase/phosphoglucomutase
VIESRIFREYDIRGVWEKDLTPEAVAALGRAFACYLKERLTGDTLTVSVGRDARLSSPRILEILCTELTQSGVNVVDIGLCPTPLQYFSLFQLPVDGGIMITGSHNPPEFNGLKVSVGTETLFGESIQALRALVEKGTRCTGRGEIRAHNIVADYIEFMKGRFSRLDGLKAVLDAGNGVGGIVAPELMRSLGADVVELYTEPDGRFPNHHPDPVVLENVRDLARTVKKTGAHVGVGYDGDADRIGVVDERGEVVWGDRLMVIFSRDVLRERPGATIIGEVKCSQSLYEDITAHGGQAVMWKTGHSLIKKKMKDSGAALAGEMSGHIFFADRYYGYDDAVYASLRLLEVMKKNGKPYSVRRLLEDLPRTVFTPEIRVDFPDEKKFEVPSLVKDAFADYPIIDIDGIRIQFPEGWGLIRASNTQPALVLRFEARDEESLKKIRRKVERELRRVASV